MAEEFLDLQACNLGCPFSHPLLNVKWLKIESPTTKLTKPNKDLET